MPNADTPYNSGFPGWFVHNVFQHHGVLAPTGCCDHQPLLGLAQGDGGVAVLHGEVRRHDPIEVIADRPRFGVHRAAGVITVVRAASPQRGDVFVRQVHVIANIHGPKMCVRTYRVTVPTIQPLKNQILPLQGKRKERFVNQCRRANQSLLVNRTATGGHTHSKRQASQNRDCET